MKTKRVHGKDHGDIMLYALSTCVWCSKVKNFLDSRKIRYGYIDVDLISQEEKESVLNEVKKWNPSCSFPTVVVNNNACIVGYNEEKISKAIGI